MLSEKSLLNILTEILQYAQDEFQVIANIDSKTLTSTTLIRYVNLNVKIQKKIFEIMLTRIGKAIVYAVKKVVNYLRGTVTSITSKIQQLENMFTPLETY